VSRRVAFLAAVVALATAGALPAATGEPLVGTWTVKTGGKGSVVIREASSAFTFVAGSKGLNLGCVMGAAGEGVGFAELPSHTKLPAGTYHGTFGFPGQGCSYDVRLVVKGNTMTGRVDYSENDNVGGPFTFTRVGGAPKATGRTYAWKVSTKGNGATLTGSGRVSADASGGVVGSQGSLSVAMGSSRWKLTVDPPGTLKVGANGTFTLTLSVEVTSGTCLDRAGTVVISKGHAKLSGICTSPPVSTAGTATLR